MAFDRLLQFANPTLQVFYVGVMLVILPCGDSQILNPIVIANPIEMMNDLVSGERSTNGFLHNHTVFRDLLSRADTNENVSITDRSTAAPLWILLANAAHLHFAADGDTGFSQSVFNRSNGHIERLGDSPESRAILIHRHDSIDADIAKVSPGTSRNTVSFETAKDGRLDSAEPLRHLASSKATAIERDDFIGWNASAQWPSHNLRIIRPEIFARGF